MLTSSKPHVLPHSYFQINPSLQLPTFVSAIAIIPVAQTQNLSYPFASFTFHILILSYQSEISYQRNHPVSVPLLTTLSQASIASSLGYCNCSKDSLWCYLSSSWQSRHIATFLFLQYTHNPLQYSRWKKFHRRAWWATDHVVEESQTGLSTHASYALLSLDIYFVL